jgi:peptide chain release factor 1
MFSNINWGELEDKYKEILNQINSCNLDNLTRAKLQRQISYLSNLISKHNDIKKLEDELDLIEKDILKIEDKELLELYKDEAKSLKANIEKEYLSLNDLIFPPDELDSRAVFLEIRAGTGGQEASLFAADLMKMYTNYALSKNWKISIADISVTDLGGYREIILHIEGKDVYGELKFESGVHRVQRVPLTETAGRIHTSTASVAVLPEAEEVDITINPSDLRIDVYRSSGAGGQHVNTTDSAVRITHIPTGVVVTCQDERSQHKNKAKALKILQSRLLALEKEKQENESSQKRKELIGSASRAEKIRTYNFPQNRITDHRIDLTLKNLDFVLEGHLEEIISALRKSDKEQKFKNFDILKNILN